MARPTKWTDEREQAVLDALRAGLSRRGAAEYAGIDVRTFERRMARFVGFAATVRQAEASVEMRAVGSLTQAWAEGDWRAGLAWLERRRRGEWARTHRVEIMATIVEMARAAGVDQALAVAEAERFLREIRRGAG